MKTFKFAYLITGLIVISTSIPFNSSATATPLIAQATQKLQAQRPPTKTTTISVEGEKTPITLKLYQHESPKFSTYFPQQDFIVEPSASDEGTSARFIVNFGGTRNDNAYVHFFFPAKTTSLSQIRQMVSGKRGLLATNKWQLVSRDAKVPYAWARERIFFKQRQGKQSIMGSVLIGESRGNAFYVITHYPADYGDGFEPRANIILQNVQFSR